jgi:hypothetical protein
MRSGKRDQSCAFQVAVASIGRATVASGIIDGAVELAGRKYDPTAGQSARGQILSVAPGLERREECQRGRRQRRQGQTEQRSFKCGHPFEEMTQRLPFNPISRFIARCVCLRSD